MNAIQRSIRVAAVSIFICVFSIPAFAGNKEQEMMLKLQIQVQALQDQMARMQQSFDERMGVMKNLVEQTSDGVNRMNGSLATLDKSVKAQNGDNRDTNTQVSTQIQALHDSVDELKSRVNKAMKQLDDIQSAQQSMQAAVAAQQQAQATPPTPQAPPPDVLYDNALRDYTSGKYDLASGEFTDYLKYYSNTDKAGNAQFYLADILYKQGDFEHSIPAYDKVTEQYPDGTKVAAAQLKKGFALVELNQKPAGVKELRSLIARFPNSEEADLARERLKKIGALPTGIRKR